MEKEEIHFRLEKGSSICSKDGLYENDHPDKMADFHFYHVNPGDRIECQDKNYQYSIAFYTHEIEEYLMHTYCYQEEENWAKYFGKYPADEWIQEAMDIEKRGWVRIVVKRSDGKEIEPGDKEKAEAALTLRRGKEKYHKKYYFDEEIEKTIATVNQLAGDEDLIFGLMADSHYVINGGWEDSLANLKAVHEKVRFDFTVHLGDLTDGLVPLAVTKEYARKVLNELESLNVPVFLTLGNHDSNYFHDNPEWMSKLEQSEFYLGRELPWYYRDFETQKVRCVFLYSFDHREKIRYGFPEEEVEWLEDILMETPNRYRVIVFSHVPLLPEMHFWSKEIRNSERIKEILDSYVIRGGKVLAYIHGHNHADQLEWTEYYPIVSIGCVKCEDFQDKKPKGSITFERKMGTLSQELWDVCVVHADKEEIDFIRFGAGEDRTIEV